MSYSGVAAWAAVNNTHHSLNTITTKNITNKYHQQISTISSTLPVSVTFTQLRVICNKNRSILSSACHGSQITNTQSDVSSR